ncbi:hypothetical protein Pmani_036085 [Petrolisthes manimaculis]|uniref:Uncharacterized protein n=1 Tax=Petrolisthes manimaculis TaxID=1843537 RepID=A0AAE1NL35_9EUCA|nr:hypothetical protein Pmani_036085 [Petrolisthes manimaculis]
MSPGTLINSSEQVCPLLCSMVVGDAGLVDFLMMPSPHDTPLLHSTGGSSFYSVENLGGVIKEELLE